MELFAGQCDYEDRTESTSLLILKKAVRDPNIGGKLIAEFNDKTSKPVEFLKRAMSTAAGTRHDLLNPAKSGMNVRGISICPMDNTSFMSFSILMMVYQRLT